MHWFINFYFMLSQEVIFHYSHRKKRSQSILASSYEIKLYLFVRMKCFQFRYDICSDFLDNSVPNRKIFNHLSSRVIDITFTFFSVYNYFQYDISTHQGIICYSWNSNKMLNANSTIRCFRAPSTRHITPLDFECNYFRDFILLFIICRKRLWRYERIASLACAY